MVRTEGTYQKLDKVFTGSYKDCDEIVGLVSTFPVKDVKVCTRGNNRIAYYRPNNGREINDKIWMMHWNDDDTVSLWM